MFTISSKDFFSKLLVDVAIVYKGQLRMYTPKLRTSFPLVAIFYLHMIYFFEIKRPVTIFTKFDGVICFMIIVFFFAILN